MKTFWVARDEDGGLCLFIDEPVRGNTIWITQQYDDECSVIKIPKELFPELTWNDKPIEVELIIRNK